MASSPNINYNMGYYPYNSYQPQWQAQSSAAYTQPAGYATKPQTPQTLSHIPYQPDVLSLSTKPSQYQAQNALNTPQSPVAKINTQNSAAPLQNTITNAEQNTAAGSSLEAQMPAPNIQTNQTEETLNTPEPLQTENAEENKETPLPSLNVGVVDAPNNASLTPITDDINSRAGEIEQTRLPDKIQNNNSLQAPSSLGKKPINAGKLSAGLMFGSLGLVILMLVPKGISKFVKLIKHK